MEITAYKLASRYLDVEEIYGGEDHPLIQWWLMNCGFGPEAHDETPWCAAFVNGIAWELGLPRPRFPSRARSWLTVGLEIQLSASTAAWDIAILQRGSGAQPPASVIDAPGHVGFVASWSDEDVTLLGGNQANCVSIASFHRSRLLGVRRLQWL